MIITLYATKPGVCQPGRFTVFSFQFLLNDFGRDSFEGSHHPSQEALRFHLSHPPSREGLSMVGMELSSDLAFGDADPEASGWLGDEVGATEDFEVRALGEEGGD